MIDMAKLIYDDTGRLLFTEEMRKEYKILIPSMSPYHFEYLVHMFKAEGYDVELLKNNHTDLFHVGMKYSHNDICVPAMLVIGQFIEAIQKGGYDIHKVALVLVQTGGGCRASNYVSLLRKALLKAGYEFIPVISLNAVGIEPNPGLKITLPFVLKLLTGLLLGDTIMQLYNEVKPYEINPRETERVYEEVNEFLDQYFYSKTRQIIKHPHKLFLKMIKRFSEIPVDRTKKIPKIGIVGEIYVKYSPLGNNELEEMLRKEGCEVIVPNMLDFILYTFDSSVHDIVKYGGRSIVKLIYRILIAIIEHRRNLVRNQLENHGFRKNTKYKELRVMAKDFISNGMHVGEGWLITAEMVELIHIGAPNIVCAQPFGCLPNHIAGKGMIKKLRSEYPLSNIVAIDYDTSATEINQMNRIKLMLTNARNNLHKLDQ